MSLFRRTLRPALGALSASAPLVLVLPADQKKARSKVHCSSDPWVPVMFGTLAAIGGTAVAMYMLSRKLSTLDFLKRVSSTEADTISKKVEHEALNEIGGGTDMCLAIEHGIESMWVEFVNWCHRQSGLKELTQQHAMEFAVPVDVMQNLRDTTVTNDDLVWLRPLLKWTDDPKILKWLDFNGDECIDFREFAMLLVLAMTQTQHAGNATKITKRSFIKILYHLMDWDGDGTISWEEFSYTCTVLAALGMMDFKRANAACRNHRKGQRKSDGSNVKTTCLDSVIFEELFNVYSKDSKGIGQQEWDRFTSECLQWNLKE